METELTAQCGSNSSIDNEMFQESATDGWTVDALGLVAGISFDKCGMHVTQVWTNGCLVYERVAWNRVARYVREWWGRGTDRWVDDIHINDGSAGLTDKQRKLKKTLVAKLLAMPAQMCLRVSWRKTTYDSTATGRDGKAQSIEAASHGYLKSLRSFVRNTTNAATRC